MAEHKELMIERLYLREPNTDKLRKGAAARLKHLLANGWRETVREQNVDYIAVHLERTGHPPLKGRLPKGPPVVQGRFDRRPRQGGGFGGGRGGRGGFQGGRGGYQGSRSGGRPAPQTGSPAQQAAPSPPPPPKTGDAPPSAPPPSSAG